jgi:hypothetical protein
VLEDASRAAAIQLPTVAKYHKGFGPASDPSSLDLIRGEIPSSEMVEVRNTPVRLGVGWWGRAFHLHALSPGRGAFTLGGGSSDGPSTPLSALMLTDG